MQREVAKSARIDRADYSRIEAGKLRATVPVTYRVGAVLGLDVSMRAFPGGRAIRDAGQATLEQKLIGCVATPLTHRIEVGLPQTGDYPDPRSWDMVLFGHGKRTAIEFERRLYDLQAQVRRFALKRRDDPVDHFLLVVADTPSNRRVLTDYADLLADLPRLRTADVLAVLRSGQHPPTGHIVLDAPMSRPRQAPDVGLSHQPGPTEAPGAG